MTLRTLLAASGYMSAAPWRLCICHTGNSDGDTSESTFAVFVFSIPGASNVTFAITPETISRSVAGSGPVSALACSSADRADGMVGPHWSAGRC